MASSDKQLPTSIGLLRAWGGSEIHAENSRHARGASENRSPQMTAHEREARRRIWRNQFQTTLQPKAS